MRGATGLLFMFSTLSRSSRIAAFARNPSLSSCPSSSSPHIAKMSSAASASLDTVAGDGIGGMGITLVPKVKSTLR